MAEHLERETTLAGVEAPSPALVTLGVDSAGLVLIDIEHAGSIEVSGVGAGTVLSSVVSDLATSRWSDQVDLVLVGLDIHLDGIARVRSAPTVGAALAEALQKVEERQALTSVVGRPSAWASRWAGGGDAWDLLVLVVAPWAVEADPVAAQQLVRVCQDRSSGVVAVCGSESLGARWRVQAHGGPITVLAPELDESVVCSEQVGASVTTGVASLADVAISLDGALGVQAHDDRLTTPIPEYLAPTPRSTVARISTPEGSAPEVEVRILGPIEILGADRPFSRAWTIELVVYLAMHPGGVTTDQWSTALWPERLMAPASVHSTASAARRALGAASNGLDHLPRSNGRLSLGETVMTDWDRFVSLASTQESESWRAALALIRGRPFEGLRSCDWALLEGIEASIEATVVDVACRLAEISMVNGDTALAEWAARQGLRVSPYDERLFRILLRCADLAGNPAGVESVMAELVHLVADDIEPFDAVHPETLELYRSLSRRREFGARSLVSPKGGAFNATARHGQRA